MIVCWRGIVSVWNAISLRYAWHEATMIFALLLNANLFMADDCEISRSSINTRVGFMIWHYALFKFAWKRPSSMSPGRQSFARGRRRPDEIDYRIHVYAAVVQSEQAFHLDRKREKIRRMCSTHKCLRLFACKRAHIYFKLSNFHLVIKYTFNPIFKGEKRETARAQTASNSK